ncbi:glycosyltransferase [Tessaracoccus palaemonis]|uniref:Glycosyltransferase n=1 Tax=Tessaracoccus palaemonis TaxID=2829499 RepID=A0ABX8SGS0_9ACTN|nr:glycosyltransferase [Tessaracoccus palaemonis]QXT62607.1 glycosyltransferase [Tessaracoccus palaemonis]
MTSSAQRARRPIKVAEFVDNYGPGSNGLMFAVQQLEGNLLDAGHEVVVVAPAAKGPNPHFGRTGRTEIRLPSVRVPKMPTRVANGRHFERTIDRVADMAPDVIHVHGFGTVGALGAMTARRLGIPMLLTWHTDFDAYADHYSAVLPLLTGVLRAFTALSRGELVDSDDLKMAEVRYEDRGRSTALLLGVCQKMLESATLVTTPSPKTAKRCLQMAPDITVRVVPNGVDPLPSGPPPFPHPDGPMVIYAGRIAPEKGIPLLADAFTLVHAQRPDARLCIVGDWERYTHIKRILQEGRAAGRIILPGEQKRDALGAYYCMADIFAFASQTDTQALVLHEAALAGLPIVSVDHELDLVVEPGVNGEFTRPTPASLAAGLLRVMDRLEDDAWRTRAKTRSVELASQWSIDSQAHAMLDIYEELAGALVDA